MFLRRFSFIAAVALLPSLSACGSEKSAPPPPGQEAMKAVTDAAGVSKEQLAREVDDLFSKSEVGETRALVLMVNGRIAAQRYAPGYHENIRFVSWSMAKSITAVMIGMLVADGELRLDMPVPIAHWQRPGDARGEITLRQLLQMRSGLNHTEGGDPPYSSSEVRMLFLDGRDNMAAFAEAQPLEAEPGAQFEYSSNTTVILADIAARVLSPSDDPEVRRAAVNDYLKSRIFTPLGMESAVAEFDASGTMIGGSSIYANARDWARFGEFLRNKGSYLGSQLVPRKWVEEMVSSSPVSPQYGFQIWLNRPYKVEEGQHHPLFPERAPHNLFAMIGHMGQYVFVSPSQGVTLVRLGHSDAEERQAMLQEAADILALYPVK